MAGLQPSAVGNIPLYFKSLLYFLFFVVESGEHMSLLLSVMHVGKVGQILHLS